MSLLISGTSNGSLNNLSLSSNTATIVDTGRAGGIVQVVQSTYSTVTSNNTTTEVDTGLSATITPTSSSNKILVFASQNGLRKVGSYGMNLFLYRGTTLIQTIGANIPYDGGSGRLDIGGTTGVFLDSPSTTSATTYKTSFRLFTTTSTVYVQAGGDASTMTLIEVVA